MAELKDLIVTGPARFVQDIQGNATMTATKFIGDGSELTATEHYGICSTAAATQEKAITISGLGALYDGCKVSVKFTNYQNYNGAPTLNVNEKGAVPIKRYGTTNAARYDWTAGEVVDFVYDLSDANNPVWIMKDGGIATTTYYGVTKLSSAVNSTSTSLAASAAAVKTAYDLAASKIGSEPNAGFHNSIYRGKYLGTAVTSAQYTAIDAGTFDDLYIGDYWTIDSINWRIAAFDYWLHTGDTECTTHHVVIVPDAALHNAKMNSSDSTSGGYYGSDFYTGSNSNTGKSSAITKVNNAFGSAHILNHRELLTNAVSSGAASGFTWADSTVELMNETMVYGYNAWGKSPGFETCIDKVQLPLFAFNTALITTRSDWWLRGIYSSGYFCRVADRGYASYTNASVALGVRPVFAIKA